MSSCRIELQQLNVETELLDTLVVRVVSAGSLPNWGEYTMLGERQAEAFEVGDNLFIPLTMNAM